MYKLSVVIPVYNTEQYLPRCIESLINQTYKNIEFIFVNDCSPQNAEEIIKEYQEKAGEYGFKIEALGVMTQAEVNQATDTLISKGVDCFTNLTDNNVVGVLPSILEKTNEAGIPVYGSEIEQVKLGCVASAGIEYVALGRQTGMMAAKILKGEAKASDMPYETISEFEIYVNPDAMAALKLSADVENAIDVTAE